MDQHRMTPSVDAAVAVGAANLMKNTKSIFRLMVESAHLWATEWN